MTQEGRINNPGISSVVKYIVVTLEERIRTGEYEHGQWLPSERDLAREFNVNRVHIRAAIAELERRHFIIRSARCRPLVQNVSYFHPPAAGIRYRNVGLWIWPNVIDPGASCIIRGIQRALKDDTFRLVIANASTSEDIWEAVIESEARFLERMAQDRDTAGIILWCLGSSNSLPALQAVRAAGIPLVFVDRQPPPGFEADYVGVDNKRAAGELVQHLIGQGHRRIAHITNLDSASTVAERLEGYRHALSKANIPFYPDLVLTETLPTPECPNVCDALVEKLLSLPDPPTAVFTVNDQLALRLIAALRARGVRVPEDLAVAGFDGIQRWMPGEAFLTTADQPFERIGEWAVELLLRRIEMGPSAPYQHILLEAPLSIHDSTRLRHRDDRLSQPVLKNAGP